MQIIQKSSPVNFLSFQIFPGMDMGGGWHVSFGIGAFPFTFLTAGAGVSMAWES